jgi:hypothetical protein
MLSAMSMPIPIIRRLRLYRSIVNPSVRVAEATL